MRKVVRISLVLFWGLCVESIGILYAQQKSAEPFSFTGRYYASLIISRVDSTYQLPKEFVIAGSERVLLDSVTTLTKGQEYTINCRFGMLSFSPAFLSRIHSDTVIHKVHVTFRTLPLNFKREYFLRNIEVRTDSTGKNRSVISQSSSQLFTDDFFGAGLQKSGSIVRGFSVGSNRDLSLSSGFRMQLAGKLAQDVDVTAALTDENSPIQPEGTTQTLREVDKVYIEIKHPQYSAVLGDFNLEIGRKEGGEFGRLNRKLQGARGVAAFDRIGGSDYNISASLTGATARGKYTTNQFQGMEGVQGPYRLTGPNGENRLLVIAGSERVYLNGELMTRGDVNDYIIDYSNGEVTFASRRLMTSASRITIDFEYSDQQFIRNLVAGSINAQGVGNKVNLNISFAQEADDPDSPINATLNDTTRANLRQSGSNRMKASLYGVTRADSGKGQYILQADTINGKIYAILQYAPGDPQAFYTAQFSPVDQVAADSAGYIRIAAGEYRFAGIGQGNYLPLQFLPMPQLHQVINVNGQASLTSDFSVAGEYAVSNFNQNRFANQDSSTLKGNAFSFAMHYNPKSLRLGNAALGEVDMHLSERFVNKNFVGLDRTNEVEFNRKWDLTSASTADEEIQEVSLAYRPVKSVSSAVTYGALNRPGEVRSTRTQLNLGLADSSLPVTQYQIEQIKTSNTLLRDESHWIRQRGTMDYEIARWHPGLRIESEERTAVPVASDSVRQGSFRYFEVAPRFTTAEFSKMTASVEYQFRTEDSASAGTLNRASHSLTQLYGWQLNNIQLITSSLTVSLRSVEFTDEFKARGNLNSDAILVRSQTRFTPFQRAVESEFYYEFSNQRSARLERVFVRVARGNGNYRYIGDVNGNGIVDENDFERTLYDGDYIVVNVPSDQLYPVADLKASTRLRLQPARLIQAPTTWMSKALRALSTETYLRVDEKSSDADTKHIYLLELSHFLNEQTTIAGSQQITQDLFLFENSADLSFRFRYNERFGLTQFISIIERSFSQERSIRVRSQLVQEIGNQTDFINKTDQVSTTTPAPQERNLVSNSLLSDFSYRPAMNWEVGFNFGVTEVINYFGLKTGTANINEEGLRVVQSFPAVGQLRAEFTRDEVTLQNTVNPPYEMTSGKVVGQSYLWQLMFDYRITDNLQISVNYNGRKEGVHDPIHFARMEARAFF